jgi:hypothetical protein
MALRTVSGTDILVATAALAIISQATNGRMTLQRMWAMGMRQRRSIHESPLARDSFPRIEYYGGMNDTRDDFPLQTPGFCYNWHDYEASFMRELGDPEFIQQVII